MAGVKKLGPKKIITLFPSPLIPTESNDKDGEEKKKLRVAAYYRVSSGSEEQKTSYVAQVDYYSKYLAGHSEYIYCGIYADEGITGTSIKRRPDFQRMLQDCREGKLDLIIAKSVSRFGRNTLDCLICIRELKGLGVDVYFEKENIHTLRSEGEILLSLMAAVSQAESESLSSNVSWGIRRKYEKGHVQCIPSGKFLGYDKDAAGNLVINEEQAVIIRRIYQEFLDGYGYYTIANMLTADGILTEQHKKSGTGVLSKRCSPMKSIWATPDARKHTMPIRLQNGG